MKEHRRRCLREKEAVCEVCGSDGPVDVHHANGDRSDDSLDNLIPLCRSCHRLTHEGQTYLSRRLEGETPYPVIATPEEVEQAERLRQKDVNPVDQMIQELEQ